ncbi:MAG: DUF3617 domain-containing protein [Parasphingopyxis sp.]|nr:DUF3617 domain-containing protein [Sphingomonadales bacterium]
MQPKRFAALAATALCAPVAFAAMQAPDTQLAEMATGKWRSTIEFTEFDIPGLPPSVAGMVRSQLGRSQTTEYCVTPDDLRRPSADAMGGEGAENCEYEDWSYRGGEMRAVLVCEIPGQGRARMEMTGTGTPTTYRSTIASEMSGTQMGTIRMNGTVTGERIGDC